MIPHSWPETVSIGGDLYEFRHRPGKWVISRLAHDDWYRLIIANLSLEGRFHLAMRMADADDILDVEDINIAAHIFVQQVCGYDYPPATRLAAAIYDEWAEFEVWCIRNGFSPLVEPPGRLLSGALGYLLEGASDAKEVNKMIGKIWTPGTIYTVKPISRHAKTGWDEPQEVDLSGVTVL